MDEAIPQYELMYSTETPHMPLIVKIKKLHPDAVTPQKATHGSAAYDLFCPKDTVLTPGRQVIPLYIAIELPFGFEAKVEARSGYSSKGFPATLAETEYRIDADVITGKIDSDYRGGIGVIVDARISRNYIIKARQKIAQLTIYKAEEAEFAEVEDLSDTERGAGAFGYSGI